MFEKPEDVRMTREEMEAEGRKLDAENVAYEHVEVLEEARTLEANQVPPPKTDEEIKKLVGKQNFANAKNDSNTSSINS